MRAEELRNIQECTNQVTDDLVRVQEAQDALLDSSKTLLNNLTSSDDAILKPYYRKERKYLKETTCLNVHLRNMIQLTKIRY